MKEEYKYLIIKKLVENNGNKNAAALRIGCTVRHVNRMIKGYCSESKGFFIHENKRKQPVDAIPENTITIIIDLYKTKYYGANFTHYSELLATKEHISVAPNTIMNILRAEYILSPKASRATKKRVKEELLSKQETSCISDDVKLEIEKSIIAIEDAHPRRPCCAYLGEMIQMDASLHLWFGNTKFQLYVGIYDATRAIVGAYFDNQETLKG